MYQLLILSLLSGYLAASLSIFGLLPAETNLGFISNLCGVKSKFYTIE